MRETLRVPTLITFIFMERRGVPGKQAMPRTLRAIVARTVSTTARSPAGVG